MNHNKKYILHCDPMYMCKYTDTHTQNWNIFQKTMIRNGVGEWVEKMKVLITTNW